MVIKVNNDVYNNFFEENKTVKELSDATGVAIRALRTLQPSDLQLLKKYTLTVRTLNASGLSPQEIFNELTQGNANHLLQVSEDNPGRFSKLCQIKGVNQIILQLDLYKYFYFLTHVDEVESICNKEQCSFEALSQRSYSDLVNLRPYTLENLSPWICDIYKNINIKEEKKYDMMRKLMTQSTFCKYYARYNPQTIGIEYDLFGGSTSCHLIFLVPLIEKIMTEKNRQYNEVQKKSLQHLHNLWTSARDISLLHEIDNEDYGWTATTHETAMQFLLVKIKNLKNSDTQDLIFSGGWKDHSVMYGIKRDIITGIYTFSVWNTGEKLDKQHYCIAGLNPPQYQIRASWSGLTLEQVSDYSFLNQLRSAKMLEYTEGGNIYSLLEQQFHKRQDSFSKNPLDYHYEQQVSECSRKSLWAASADSLGRSKDRRFAFQIQLDLLSELQKEFEDIPVQYRLPVDTELIGRCNYKKLFLKTFKIDIDINAEIKKSKKDALKNSYCRLSEPNTIHYRKVLEMGNFS